MARSNRLFIPKLPESRRVLPPLGMSLWNSRWFKLVFFSGVLLMAALFGQTVAKSQPLFTVVVAALPLVIVGVQWLLMHEEWITVLLLFAAVFVPLSLSTGTGSRLVLSLVLTLMFVAIWIARMVVVDRRIRLTPIPTNLPLIGFMVTTVISLVWGILLRDPMVFTSRSFLVVQMASAAVMVMLPCVYLMLVNFTKTRRELVVIVVFLLIATVFGFVKQMWNVRLPVNTGGMFNLWVMAICTGLALYVDRISKIWRVTLILMTGAWVYYSFVVNISWMAGWLPAVIAVAIIIFARSRKWFAVVALIALIVVLVRSDYYLSTVLNDEANISGYTRLDAWMMNWRITKDHLLFGTGPAGYAIYYMSYFPDQATATHSNYIDILAQTGLVGIGMIVWFFIAQIVSGIRLVVRLRGRHDLYEAMAVVSLGGSVACMIIMAFGDWLFPFAYTQTIAGFDYALYNWVFMGFTFVIDRLTRPGQQEVALG